jgi:hypothetical protein
MSVMQSFKYLRPVLSVLVGSGAALGGSYLFSRIKERQETETRLARLEHLLEELVKVEQEKSGQGKVKNESVSTQQ